MPNYNFPDKDDPDFADKLVLAIQDLFDQNEGKVKQLPPISNPEEGLQVGAMWYDIDSDTVKVNTPTGIKTITFDP